MWNPNYKGFHWENSAFLGKNFSLTACALVLDGIVGVVEKKLMKWQPKSGETEQQV